MIHLNKSAALPLLALTLSSATSARAQTVYNFTDLGVINPSSTFASALGINNAGQIVGETKTNANTTRVFRVTPVIDGSGHPVWYVDANGDGVNGLMQLLPLPTGFTFSYAYAGAINAAGQSTGVAIAARSTAPQDAIVWSAAGVSATLSGTNVTSSGLGLNDHGDVAGNYYDYKKNKPAYPYLWQFTNGVYTAVQLTTAAGTAYTVNNHRQVLGNNGSSFLWLPAPAYGLPKGITVLNGIGLNTGKNLNNSGLISGTVSSNGHLSIWTPPGSGAAFGLFDGVNDLGSGPFSAVSPCCLSNPIVGGPLQIVGVAQDSANNQFAFVWDSSTRTIWNLNALVSNLPAGWILRSANSINDYGLIVGTGTYNGSTRAFVLTP